MAGKRCNGVAADAPTQRESHSYCEGRSAAASGVSAAYASGTTGAEGDDNGITWTAAVYGEGLAIALIDAGEVDADLAVTVGSNGVFVSLATDGAGDISSTAADVIAGVAGVPAAAALMAGANTGGSSGLATVVAEIAYLTGGSVPFATTSRDGTLWIAGFDSWSEDPAGFPARDCCADAPGGGYTP